MMKIEELARLAAKVVKAAVEKTEALNEASTLDWEAMKMACEIEQEMGMDRQTRHEFETEIWRALPED